MKKPNTDSTNIAGDGSCLHFSVSRTEGTIPEFLRRIATHLEERNDPEVMDIAFARYWTRVNDVLEYETTITVYYCQDEDH